MLISKNLRTSGSLAALLLILVLPVQAIAPAPEGETYLEIETETAGEVTNIRIWLSHNAIRIDADTQGWKENSGTKKGKRNPKSSPKGHFF